MQLSNYAKCYAYPDSPGYVLLFSTKTAAAILMPESTLRSLEEGALPASDEETLAELGFLVEDVNEEKAAMLRVFDPALWDGSLFSGMVVLNLDCNLACGYCYEGGLKGKRYMSDETVELLLRFMETRYLSKGRSVHLSFSGGEPLLSTDVMKEISSALGSAAQEKGLTYGFNLITNGTLLTRRRTEELVSLGLHGAKVTLDGPRETHDRSRPFISGAGSFDAIVRNIRDVCDIIEIQIGGNYSAENYREFPELLDYFIEEGITPDRVSVVKFVPVSKTGEKFAPPEYRGGCVSINEPWLLDASLFLREEILKRGFRTSAVAPSVCMIESPQDLVIHYDGVLYKCPAFLGYRDLEAGDLETGMKDYAVSHGLDIWKKQECLDCAYLPLCYGGCRYMTLLRDGAIDEVDCRKPYFDATLEGFVKQDLTYQRPDDR